MLYRIQPRPLVALALLTIVVMASAQTQRQSETFAIQGYTGQANVIRAQGRVLVDVEDLARITKGSLSFESDQVILTLPHGDSTESAGGDDGKARFSRAFMKAAIEAMASIREWGGTLQAVVQNGFPVGNTAAGNTIMAFEGRAAESVALASAAASTDSDYRGLGLLRNEFNHVQAWSDSFIQARNSLRATELTMSENVLNHNQEAQKLVHCGQFLAQMFGGGTFEDDAACH
jgi:hypothetical protein